MNFAGIDPGLDGAVVCIGEEEVSAQVVPTLADGKKAGKRIYDVQSMVACIQGLRQRGSIFVALEKGRAGPQQGVSSMFRFGYGCGLWEGILAALQIPYIIVHPNTWQRAVCPGLSGEAKARAVQAASSMLPQLDLRKSTKAFKPHQGIADAACLALYARTFRSEQS